jgi:drug/metabolite transporter (DMT)-like permease
MCPPLCVFVAFICLQSPEMEVTDQQKLGVGLGGFGVFFLLLGVLLLFDKGLLAIGNLFCIAGDFC